MFQIWLDYNGRFQIENKIDILIADCDCDQIDCNIIFWPDLPILVSAVSSGSFPAHGQHLSSQHRSAEEQHNLNVLLDAYIYIFINIYIYRYIDIDR